MPAPSRGGESLRKQRKRATVTVRAMVRATRRGPRRRGQWRQRREQGKEEDGCRGDDQRDGTTTTEAARAATSMTARRRRGQRARVRMPTARTGAYMMEDNIVVRTRRHEDSKMTTVIGWQRGNRDRQNAGTKSVSQHDWLNRSRSR